jgi:HSP20 family protein
MASRTMRRSRTVAITPDIIISERIPRPANLPQVANSVSGTMKMLPTRRTSKTVRLQSVDLPGVNPQDIGVSVAGNTLTIRASRERRSNERNLEFELREVSYGIFERSVALPEGIKSDQVTANYQNGVLELTMRRRTRSPENYARD